MTRFAIAFLALTILVVGIPANAQTGGPTPFMQACPEPTLQSAKIKDPTSLDLYDDASRAYGAWHCAHSMSKTLASRKVALDEAQEQYDEWIDLRKKLKLMEDSLYNRSRVWYHTPPKNYRARYLSAILYGKVHSLTWLDRTGVHSASYNKNDPLAGHPAFQRELLKVVGKSNYDSIMHWEKRDPPLYQQQDQKNPIAEARWATEAVINKVWANRPNIYPTGNGAVFRKHSGVHNSNWQARRRFSCEFWGKIWETYWVEVYNDNGHRWEERTRCTEAAWPGGQDFLTAFKRERDLACDMVHPKHDDLDNPHLLPRCSYPDRLEREAVRENNLPQSAFNRKYGKEAVDEIQAWYNQAKEASDSLPKREAAFEKAVLKASGDRRVPYLVAKYRRNHVLKK